MTGRTSGPGVFRFPAPYVMKNGIIQLENFLTKQAGAKTAKLREHYKLTAGAIQENWAINVEFTGGPLNGMQELCLRIDAPTSIGNSRSRMEEFAFLWLAHRGGVRVPEPLFFSRNKQLIGRPFFVMRRIGGIAEARTVTQTERTAAKRDQLLTEIGWELATIHRLNPTGNDFQFLTKPRVAPARYVIKQCLQALDALPQPAPVLEWGLRWAQLNLPKVQKKVLCHRDYRTGNLMIDCDRLIGVLDWEFCGWSDPMEDIAWFCAKCWRFGFNDREAGGIGPRKTFYQAYEETAQRTIDHEAVMFWEVIAHIRWAIIAHQQGERFATYGEKSLEPAMTAFIAPQLEWEVMQMTKGWDA